MASGKGLIVFLLSVLLIAGAGCAHGRSLKSGDEHYERGDYAAALQSYRDAQVAKPGSEEAAARALDAERQLVDDAIGALEDARRGESRVYDALDRSDEVFELLRTPAQSARLVQRFEDVVQDISSETLDVQGYGAALEVLDAAVAISQRHPGAFGAGYSGFSQEVASIEDDWAAHLLTRAQRASQGGRLASAALYGAMAQSLSGSPVAVGDPDAFAEDVRRNFGWSLLPVDLIAATEQDIQGAISEGMRHSAIELGGDSSYFQRVAVLSMSGSYPQLERWEEPEQRSQEYQSGTRLVENPDYSAQRDRLIQSEQRVLAIERDMAREDLELRKSRREYRRLVKEDWSTTGVEWDIERSEKRLVDLSEDLIDARYQVESDYLELQRISPNLEEPVFSDHVYEVIGQWARLAASLDVSVEVPSVGFNYESGFERVFAQVSYRHSAQPPIQLGRRADPPPSAATIRDGFDRAVSEALAEKVLQAFENYRRGWLEGQLSEPERIEALATYVLLSPQQVDASVAGELERLSGVPAPEGVLLRLVSETGPSVATR